MIVIGTAGHIDHGKSAIVKRLTGTDPDRLPEEKARGMTIDLGFAFRTTPDGAQIGFVDVPGHERFVKNMIAGAGGIDAVMLVVAADDGWMPQSEEHFQITRLLGVRRGFVIVNKIDLVEPDWLELLEQEVSEKVAGSFLQGAPIFRVSAETDEGFDVLKQYLDSLPSELELRKDIGKARLPVDRSFVRPGIGGVVTGTLRGGRLGLGQTVGVWPGGVTGKVRTLQSNGQDVEEATPGQRVAVSLTGVGREQLIRGGVVTDRADLRYFRLNPVLALSAEMLPNAPVSLADRRRVLLIVGTTEVEGEVRLYDREILRPSDEGLVFFKPGDPVYALVGDHYILRLPTPMVTLGGGTVLDHFPTFPRRKQLSELGYLKERRTPGIEALLPSELRKQVLVSEKELLVNADYGAEEIAQATQRLSDRGAVARTGDYLFEVAAVKAEAERIVSRLQSEFHEKPHLKGLPLDRLRQMFPNRRSVLTGLLGYLVEQGLLTSRGDLYDLAGRGMSLKGAIKQAHDDIMAVLQRQKFDPPTLSQLAAAGKNHQLAIKYIIDSGEGYKCGSDFIFIMEVWNDVVRFVREHIAEHDRLAVTNLRERFGFTRKFAIPLLEELDRLGVTQREGDFRVKGRSFESQDPIP